MNELFILYVSFLQYIFVSFCLTLYMYSTIPFTACVLFLKHPRIRYLSSSLDRLLGHYYYFSCWLSSDNGVIWAFVGPMLLIIMVCCIILYQRCNKSTVLFLWHHNYVSNTIIVEQYLQIWLCTMFITNLKLL